MAKLILSKLHCVVETNEAGWDSPYMVILIGTPNQPAANLVVKTIRKPEWDNDTESGTIWQPEMTISPSIDTGKLVLVAMMEEDVNCDFGAVQREMARLWMQGPFQAFAGSGSTPMAQLAAILLLEFKHAIDVISSNDDIVAVQHLPITKLSGNLQLLHMVGDGGYYRLKFRMAA